MKNSVLKVREVRTLADVASDLIKFSNTINSSVIFDVSYSSDIGNENEEAMITISLYSLLKREMRLDGLRPQRVFSERYVDSDSFYEVEHCEAVVMNYIIDNEW